MTLTDSLDRYLGPGFCCCIWQVDRSTLSYRLCGIPLLPMEVESMAKLKRLVIEVAAERIAEVLELLADVTESVTMQNGAAGEEEAENERRPMPQRITRPAATGRSVATAPRTRLAGRVVYTPAGTQRQIEKLLSDLRGSKTMRAFVLADLAKHPGSTNREVRERIGKTAAKHNLSIESVDNIIWRMVGDGTITKAAEAAQ